MILSDLNHDRASVKKTIKCHHESGGSVLESIFTNPTILKCVNPGKSQAVCLFASPTLRNCKVIYLGTKHWRSFLCDLVQPSKVFQRDYLYTVLKMNRSPQGARRNDEAPLYPFTLILPYISKVDATGWWTLRALERRQARKHEFVVRGGKIIERGGGSVSSDSNVNTGAGSNIGW